MGRTEVVLVTLLVVAAVTEAGNSPSPKSAGNRSGGRIGDGLQVPSTLGGRVNKTPRAQRAIETRRGKQWDYYSQWSPQVIQAPTALSFSMWQPQVYQIKRPYYIPIWSSPGKIPIYFPPQPLYSNPGYPEDNPRKSYLPGGPDRGYLPPDSRTSTSSPDDTPMIVDKFNEDAPIWDSMDTSSHRSTTTQSSIVPTRRRRPGKTTTQPPLVHKRPSSGGNQLAPMFVLNEPEQFATSTPRPVANHQPSTRPARPAQPTSRQPSRCVWAIISCCSASSGDVSYSCFEQLGCTGAFWDKSPCESEFARAAIASAMNYYNS